MTATAPELQWFEDADGVPIAYRSWPVDGDVKAIVQIAHGASEHSARYNRFARFLNRHGYAVIAGDHRGHGATGEKMGFGLAGPRGWDGMVDDLVQLATSARAELGNRPVVLFGHSMGSFLAQLVAQRHGATLAGLALSGSSGAIEGLAESITALKGLVDAGMGDQPALIFGPFNAPFEPARTPFDWLSRDEAEVDKYVADPWCGDDAPLTMAFVLDMLEHNAEAWDPTNERRIPSDLPILLITGEADPVSQGGASVRELEARYRANGVKDVTGLYYPGARHELLNETNREDVQADVLAWLEHICA